MKRLIGTRSETSLHRQLKLAYAGDGGSTEVEVAGFVVDGLSADGRCFEVQTGSFAPLLKKAGELAPPYGLRIIYPVAVARYLEVFGPDGSMEYRRKSGRRGGVWELFRALVYAPELPLIPGLEIELALAEVAEERVRDGLGSWRRGGVSIRDRRLIALRESLCLKKPSDYLRFVPFAPDEEFTTGMLRERAGITPGLAGKTLYVLARIGVVARTGKRGNSLVYRLSVGPRNRKWKKIP